MKNSFLTKFAVTYNCNNYGESTYNNNDACTVTDASASAVTQGDLATTGWNIAIGVTAGLLLIAVGAVLLLKLRRKKTD